MNYDDDSTLTITDPQTVLSGNLSEGSTAESYGFPSVQLVQIKNLTQTPDDQAEGPALGLVQELHTGDGLEFAESPAEEGQHPDAMRSDPADSPGTPLIQSTAKSLEELDHFATDLVKANSPRPLVHLRKKAKQLKLHLTKEEMEQVLSDVNERESADQIQPLKAGDKVKVIPTKWHLEGILMQGVLNIVVGPAKVGKTALIVGLLGALHRGDSSFVGLPLKGPCPRLLLMGPDQPLSDWSPMLEDIGLMEGQPDGEVLIREPISEFYHSEHSITLNQHRITAIADWCSRNPGGVVFLDSAVALTLGLDISENSPEFATPFANLQQAVAPFGATVIVIHHTKKAMKGFDPTQASRGSSAFPALASQLVGLFPYPTPKGALSDTRIVLSTKGRGGPPIQLVIERAEGTSWISHGTLEGVQAEEQERIVSLELTERQALILMILEEQHMASGEWQTTDLIKPHLPGDFSDPDGRLLRRTLKQLEAKGLIEINRLTTSTGWENRYGSKTVLRHLESGALIDEGQDGESHAAAPAEVSNPAEGYGSAQVLLVGCCDPGQEVPLLLGSEAIEVASDPSLDSETMFDHNPVFDEDDLDEDEDEDDLDEDEDDLDEDDEFGVELAEEPTTYQQLFEEAEGTDDQEVETIWPPVFNMLSPVPDSF